METRSSVGQLPAQGDLFWESPASTLTRIRRAFDAKHFPILMANTYKLAVHFSFLSTSWLDFVEEWTRPPLHIQEKPYWW